MTLEELKAMTAAGESETVELKKTTGQRSEAARSLCAMLNSRGGSVIFGAEPDGSLTGQQVGNRTIEDVSAEIGNIAPPAYPSMDRVPVRDGREAIVVGVQSGFLKPYTYKGRAYRRVGSVTLEMDQEEYNRMLFERMHAEQRWENQRAEGWTIDDLDALEIQRTMQESILRGRMSAPEVRDAEDALRGMSVMKDGRLLRAAAVLFGKPERVRAEMPQCLLRVARFSGTTRSEFTDNRQFQGNAFALLAYAERFLTESLPIASRVLPDRMERDDSPLYPREALREALANAICHRDYSIGGGSIGVAIYDDRLEITSTGPLPFGLTPEDLFVPHESSPWNPFIAGVFYLRGIIERWGRGTIRIAELMSEAGLPRPEIEDAAGCVTVRFRPSFYNPPSRITANITQRQRDILALLHRADQGVSMKEIISELGARVTPRQVRRDLDRLRSLDLIMTRGRGRGAKWHMS